MKINENHFSLTSASQVKQIINPLKKFGITFFNHVRCYYDGTYNILTSNAEWHRHFVNIEIPGSFSLFDLKQGAYLWEDVIAPEICAEARNFFDMDSLFQFIYPGKNYVDVFAFGSPTKKCGMVSFYFNNLDLLQNFTEYFKRRSRDLFLEGEKHRIVVLDSMVKRTNINNALFEHDRLDLLKILNAAQQLSNLTPLEHICLKHLARGKTAKEIARILNNSKRTVEKHIEKIKLKTNSFSKTDIIKLFYKQATIAPYLDIYE